MHLTDVKLLLCTALVAMTGAVQAHHGLDFLLVQDAALPAPWSGMVYASGEWSQTDSINSYETEAGIQFGLTPWLALGVGNGFEESGDGWQWTHTAPQLNVSLFRSDALPWLKVSLFAGYAFAEEPEVRTTVVMTPYTVEVAAEDAAAFVASNGTSVSASKSKKSSTSTGKSTKHSSGGGGSGPDAPSGTVHDHPVVTASAIGVPQAQTQKVTVYKPVVVELPREDHHGIHRHGEEGITARLIVEAELGSQDKLIFNLINFTPREGRSGWGYALGLRHEFTHHFAISAESIGDYEAEGYQQAVLAAHWSPLHSVTLKLGVGAGLSDVTPELSIHTGFVWRF